MTIKDITDHLEILAPLPYAENFDNVGLLVGQYSTEVTGVLVTLDTLETVIDEAIQNKCNLIVSFHPIVFSGFKKLNGSNYVERTVIKAIQHNIAIYAIHTALDNVMEGVNATICEALQLKNREILIPKEKSLKKLTTYVPKNEFDRVKTALFEAGAGHIGNYSHCSFNLQGTGTFMGNEQSNPNKGKQGEVHEEEEIMLNVVFKSHLQFVIEKSLKENHPYEEVAYEIYQLENQQPYVGLGMIGTLLFPQTESNFIKIVKNTFKTGCIKHSKLLGKKINKVAVLGGSGSFAIDSAIKSGADVFISSDFKYHDFFKAEGKIVLMDIGHFESEQFTKNKLADYLMKKFTNFAVVLSKVQTNPIYYI